MDVEKKLPLSPPSRSQDGHAMLKIPSDYLAGYEKARLVDPDIADKYVAHTTVGDPDADPVVDLLFTMSAEERYRLVQGCMEGNKDILRAAPEMVRDFFEKLEAVPEWFDHSATEAGIRGFYNNADIILQAFAAGVLVEGFTTNISKSFIITGGLRDQGVKRLKQNNRHIMEIFWPAGLQRFGDGWKLSVRLRLVHAQIRRLLEKSGDWDDEAWGTPLSAAHNALAAAAFSARLIMHSERMGAVFSREERESFMLVWRYTSYLIGIPDSLNSTSEKEALKLYDIGTLCEPPIDLESVVMANSLVNSVPLIVGIGARDEREGLSKLVYTVSRALIGNETADQLNFPNYRTWWVLPLLRMQARYKRALRKMLPSLSQGYRFNNMQHFLGASYYSDSGITYSLPDHAYSERSKRW